MVSIPVGPVTPGTAPKSKKWLQVVPQVPRPKLIVNHETNQSIRELGAKPLNFIMVGGSMNAGKSFLVNMLMGDPGFFKVQGGNTRCTVGADISHCMPAEAFSGMTDSRRLHVTFIDAEGQGDRGDDYDTTLGTPLFLLSKVAIFNWKGTPTKHEMLLKLGVLTKAAQRVTLQDPGTAPGEPASSNKLFSDLHIVIRDDYSDKDDVKKILLCSEQGDGDDLACRNTIRRLLMDSFASIDVHILPYPIDSSERLGRGQFNETDVVPAFRQAVANLKAALMLQVQQPRILEGCPLTCDTIARVMTDIAKGLNEGSSKILPGSAFERMEAEDIKVALPAILASFDKMTVKIIAELPLSSAYLRVKMQELERLCCNQLRAALPRLREAHLAGGFANIHEYMVAVESTLALQSRAVIEA